ncbi:MAG: TIGR04282 family arsenosugar biosynthesis glycosyltransferase [Pseudomonadota bacterium]|nr:TIGR04282 family arsenosugar biosynthesis glycosyltransferase [Pseudomonadota bacterium]
MKPPRIIIFAKAPVAGQVKTRLIPALGAERAAALARRMFQHTVDVAVAAAIGPVEVCAAPDRSDPAWHGVEVPAALAWSAQGDGDLGMRMARAAQRTLADGQAVLLIGTDCPGLQVRHLHEAEAGLRDHDAVIAPTTDGGYFILGLKQHLPAIFERMSWSTREVAFQTIARLARHRRSVRVQPMLRDVDEAADLKWVPAEWGFPPAA